MFEMDKCPWKLMLIQDEIDLYWCEKCGSVLMKGDFEEISRPSSLNQDTLYCPDQGDIPEELL